MPLVLEGEGRFLDLKRIVALPIRAARRQNILIDRSLLSARRIGIGSALRKVVAHDVAGSAGLTHCGLFEHAASIRAKPRAGNRYLVAFMGVPGLETED